MSKSLEKIATTLEKIEDELDTMNRIQTEMYYQEALAGDGRLEDDVAEALFTEPWPRKLINIAPMVNKAIDQAKEAYYGKSEA